MKLLEFIIRHGLLWVIVLTSLMTWVPVFVLIQLPNTVLWMVVKVLAAFWLIATLWMLVFDEQVLAIIGGSGPGFHLNARSGLL